MDATVLLLILAASLGFITYECIRLYSYVEAIREGTTKFSRTYFIYVVFFMILFGIAIAIYMQAIGVNSMTSAYFNGLSFPSTVTILLSGGKGTRTVSVDDIVISGKESNGTASIGANVGERLTDLGAFGSLFRLYRP